ncbi:MAG TPA: hypothetical protein VMR18_03725 [Candidatus Saccharimonadales bacterium]|jgi:hypothetical protein|nr:hypothetical protein [Candidatus Saccharimonadales bacterium]
MIEVLEQAIRSDGSSRFSLRVGRQLTANDFSVFFEESSDSSHATCDIIVIVHLHADEERVALADENADDMADFLAESLKKLGLEYGLDIGVAILHSMMGWGTSVARRKDIDLGGR